MRDPVVYAVSVARAFNATTDGVYLNAQAAAMGQSIFMPGSVFSFYQADYALPGSTTLVAPQFAIESAPTTVARLNFLYALLNNTAGIPADTTVVGSIGSKIDLSGYAALAATPASLVDRLDAVMTYSTLTPAEKAAIVAAVTAVPDSDATGRARMAAYLVAASPHYQITR